MRIKLLFVFFIITISTGAQTSVYHPFPDSNAVWIVESGCINWCPFCGDYGASLRTRYEARGDTIINSQAYHRISSIGTINTNCNSCHCIWPDWGMHYIREDTLNKKVWKLNTASMNEGLLYDFNLHVGDTVSNTLLNDLMAQAGVVIQSIDSVLIGSNYRNRYWYNLIPSGSDTCTYFLIEGIGGGGGLFSPLCANFCFESGYDLLCYSENGNPLYILNSAQCPYADSSSCNFTVSVSEIKAEEDFLIFPNPTTNELIIDNGKLKIESIEIYDMVGQSIFSQKLTPNGQQQITLDVSHLKNGIYLVQVKTKNGILSKKFIKQ